MKNNFTLPTDLSFPNILSSGGDEFGSMDARGNGPKAYGGS
jgi:(S)-2-hydroxy-acid oxidase